MNNNKVNRIFETSSWHTAVRLLTATYGTLEIFLWVKMEHFLLDGTFTDGWSAILFSSQEKAPRLPAFPQKLPQKDAAKAGGVGRPFFLQPSPEVC